MKITIILFAYSNNITKEYNTVLVTLIRLFLIHSMTSVNFHCYQKSEFHHTYRSNLKTSVKIISQNLCCKKNSCSFHPFDSSRIVNSPTHRRCNNLPKKVTKNFFIHLKSLQSLLLNVCFLKFITTNTH